MINEQHKKEVIWKDSTLKEHVEGGYNWLKNGYVDGEIRFKLYCKYTIHDIIFVDLKTNLEIKDIMPAKAIAKATQLANFKQPEQTEIYIEKMGSYFVGPVRKGGFKIVKIKDKPIPGSSIVTFHLELEKYPDDYIGSSVGRYLLPTRKERELFTPLSITN